MLRIGATVFGYDLLGIFYETLLEMHTQKKTQSAMKIDKKP